MNNQLLQHSQAWVTFTYASFLVSLAMVAIGVIFMPLDLWMEGFSAMAVLLLAHSRIAVTKTVRDNQEAAKLVNRIGGAKTERLLMDATKVS
jgi:hypothetical protein